MKADNPFTIEHVRQQVKRYNPSETQHELTSGNVKFHWLRPQGRLNDYLNVNMRFMDFDIPCLTEGSGIWMSLTPMEIQSAHVAIGLSNGIVATAGLGLGYFALEAARKDNVDEVYCFEQNPDVVKLFNTRIEALETDSELIEARQKIRIVEGDVRKTMKDYEFNFVFMDPYETLLPDEMSEDASLFRRHNNIEVYWPWGMELLSLIGLYNGWINHSDLTDDECELFHYHHTTPAHEDDERLDGITLGNLRMPVDPEHVSEFAEEAWFAIRL